MLTKQLLSGLIGTLAATFISVIYLNISEKNKHRGTVFIEVVGYCDEIYQFLKKLHLYKKVWIYNSVISIFSYRLMLAYGKGDTLMLLESLYKNFDRLNKILGNSTRSGWVNEGQKVHEIFLEEIGPLRTKLITSLLDGTRYLPTFYKFIQCLKQLFTINHQTRIDAN
jgi:hypothetical protein